MIELFLALFILGVAVFVMYRLATDPAVYLNPVPSDLATDVESREWPEFSESATEDAARQDVPPESVVAATPD